MFYRVAGQLVFQHRFLLERLENPKWPQAIGRLRPVGGRPEPGESRFATLQREFAEELGIVLTREMTPGNWRAVYEPQFKRLTWVIDVINHGLTPGRYDSPQPEHGDPYIRLVPVGLSWDGRQSERCY